MSKRQNKSMINWIKCIPSTLQVFGMTYILLGVVESTECLPDDWECKLDDLYFFDHYAYVVYICQKNNSIIIVAADDCEIDDSEAIVNNLVYNISSFVDGGWDEEINELGNKNMILRTTQCFGTTPDYDIIQDTNFVKAMLDNGIASTIYKTVDKYIYDAKEKANEISLKHSFIKNGCCL